MAGIKDITNVWNNVKEIDLRPLAEQALRGFRLAVVGSRHLDPEGFAAQLRRDPARPEMVSAAPVFIASPEEAQPASKGELVVLLLDAAAEDDSRERELAQAWAEAGLPVVVLLCRPGPWHRSEHPPLGLSHWSDWGRRRVVIGPPDDPAFLTQVFAPAVIHLLPEQILQLGRQFPLFRLAIAHQLIADTSLSNAAYALSTGVAEIVPVFDIPLNIADMFVLSKAQAFLVYKLGLALGMSTRWQDYVTEFGGVLGSGFLWRQLARQLIGLIPAWGIIPKVAVSYAGTYVVGNVVLQWYLTGRHVTRAQMRQLYAQAFARGKLLAGNMAKKLPRPKKPASKPRQIKPKKLPAGKGVKTCPACGKGSAADAVFCQYCGGAL